MEVHRFKFESSDVVSDYTPAPLHHQTYLYIPHQGILKLKEYDREVDFFSSAREDIATAKEWLKRGQRNVTYEGKVEVSDKLITKILKRGKAFNDAKKSKKRLEETTEELMKFFK